MTGMFSAEPPRLAPGTRLNGVVEIDRHIAPGRLGDVYLAHAVATGDPVAVRTLRADLAGNALAVGLVCKDASALREVRHPAIIRHYLFSQDPDTGRHFLAMEFVDGPSLAALLRRGPPGAGAVRILQERLAAGLDAAHQRGVVHGDLSPGSVLIPGHRLASARIGGFGAARLARAGILGGKDLAGGDDYAAPEQFGLFGGDVTAKTDIYRLGLVLAACLAGRSPGAGGAPAERRERRLSAPDLRAIDPHFRPLIGWMLQPDPAHRPESMAAVAAWRPREATPRSGGFAPARNGIARPAAWFGWRPPAIAAAAALLVGIGGAGFYFAPGWIVPRFAAPSIPVSPQRVIAFVNAYDGGDCFFVTPERVSDGAATLDGLGSTVAPFEVMNGEFKKWNGFEPSVGVHQVKAEQCPAVNFLFRTRHQRRAAPRLEAVTSALKDGGPLTGSVSVAGPDAAELLLVADDGYVRNLTALLKPAGVTRTFAIGIRKTSPGPPQPQILMAVASSKPLDALKLPRDGALAAEVFPRALAEAARDGQPLRVSAKYFMLEK